MVGCIRTLIDRLQEKELLKKHLIFFIVISLVISSCTLLIPDTVLAPPSWIHGTWADSYSINVYEFSSDNVILSSSYIGIDFAEVYKKANVDESASSTLYEITVKASNVNAKYTFSKLSATTINYTITESGISIGPIELTKQ